VQPDATGVGFSVEFRVPWSVLGGAAVANGRALGVDFEVDDDDNTTIQELTRYLTWWNMSSTGCNYPPACTSNFGAAQLVGRLFAHISDGRALNSRAGTLVSLPWPREGLCVT
jgi:hypothetical protein